MYQARPTRLPRHRLWTARWRGLPDGLVIGGQRCGSTSLYFYLVQHPEIRGGFRKEAHYFDYNQSRPLAWYRAHFPFEALGGFRIEASPYYLFHPCVPQRLRATLPETRLVAVLRDPVKRAYSHYQMVRRRGHETLPFEEALAKEDERLAGEEEKLASGAEEYSFNHHKFGYAARGRYAVQLERWFAHFPRDQILVLQSEAMYADPQTAVDRVCAHFALPPFTLEQTRPRNKATYDPIPDAARDRLRAAFAPHNERLYELLGERFDWA